MSGAWSLSVRLAPPPRLLGNGFSATGLKTIRLSYLSPKPTSQIHFLGDLGPGPLNPPSPLTLFQFRSRRAPQCPPFDFLPGNPRGFRGVTRSLSRVSRPDFFSGFRSHWSCLLHGPPLSLSPPSHPLFWKRLLNSTKRKKLCTRRWVEKACWVNRVPSHRIQPVPRSH